MEKIRFKKTHPNAVTPKRAKTGDAGYDLTAIEYRYVQEGVEVPYFEYKFGLVIEIPEGYVGLIFPRSSISNKDLSLTNCVGVIDSGYRGELSARFRTTMKQSNFPSIHYPRIYKTDERVAQLVIVPIVTPEFEEVEELSVTDRGAGGFGSSGA